MLIKKIIEHGEMGCIVYFAPWPLSNITNTIFMMLFMIIIWLILKIIDVLGNSWM